MIVICGMARAGTTLLWQISEQICSSHGWVACTDHNTLFSKVRDLSGTDTVLKTYFIDNGVDSDIAIADDDIVFVAKRDVRDVVASLMSQRNILDHEIRSINFVTTMARQAIQRYEFFAYHKNVNIIKYEDYVNDRMKLINHLVETINLPCDTQDEIYEYTSLDNQISRAQHAFSNHNLIAMVTARHITSGTAGAWKTVLTPDEINAINEVAGDWLIANGYEIGV